MKTHNKERLHQLLDLAEELLLWLEEKGITWDETCRLKNFAETLHYDKMNPTEELLARNTPVKEQ